MRKIKLLLAFMLVVTAALPAVAQTGSTFSNSQPIGSLPFIELGETTCGYGNNYNTQDIGCTGKYLTGEEKIYSFTPSQSSSNIEVSISNLSDNFSGLFVVDDTTASGNCLGSVFDEHATDRVISNLSLNANQTYYIIVSTWANPVCLNYDIQVLDQTCPAISDLTANSVSDASVTFSWQENGSATQWEYEYGGQGYTPGTGTLVSTTSNPATLSGLNAQSGYDIYVRANCVGNGSSYWVGPLRITTLCALVTDFTEDFELMSTGALTGCWQGHGLGTTSSASVRVYSSSTNAYSGSKSIRMVNGFNSSGDVFFIPPSVSNLDAGTHRLKFYARSLYNDQTELIVGTITDAEDASTFSPLTTITTSNNYTEYVVNMPNYSGLDYTLAIKMGYSGTYEYVYIDDVVWETMPSCIAPEQVMASVVDTTQANLTWTEIGNAQSWEVTYGLAGFTLGQGQTSIESATSKNITGLTPSTAYEYYVRSICAPGDSSIWQGPVSFYTNFCLPSPTSVDGDGITNVTMGLVNITTAAEAGNYGDYTHLVANAPRTSLLDVDITLGTGTSYEVYVWVDWNNDMVFSNVDEVYYFGESSFASVSVLSGQIEIPANATLGNHRMRIGGADYSFSSGGDPCYTGTWASFEDYTIDVQPIPSCLAVDSLQVNQITTNSASISWVEVNSASQWEYEYGPTGFTLGNGTTAVVSSTNATINGLSASVVYDVYVRAICGVTDTSLWAAPITFATECAPSTQFAQGFEVNTSNNLPICWSGLVVSQYGAGKVDVTAGNANSGSQFARLSNYGDINAQLYLVSEEVTNLNAQTNRLRFSMKAPNSDPVVVGILTNPTDASTFQAIQTIVPNGNYQEFLVGFNSTLPAQGYIAFKSIHSSSYRVTSIDDVYWETIPSCLEPLNVEGIPTQSTIQLSWTEPGSATSWAIEYGPSNFTAGTGTTIIANTNPFSIPNLDSATNYDVYVKSICGSGDSSLVQGPYYFFTDYCEATPSSARGDGITNVTIGNINNTTGAEADQYGDYTHLVASIPQTESLNLSVETTSGVSYGNFVVVAWIDLNNDLVFDNNDEMFYLGTTPSGVTGTIDMDITIPFGISVGNHRMRIIAADYWYSASSANPCYNGSNASVEDYTINVLAAPSCITPTDVTVIDVLHTSVDLGWANPAGATTWEVEVGPTGFTPGTGQLHLVNSNPAQISGLSSTTTYDFLVRAVCGPADSSLWSSLVTETTLCAPVIAPFFDDVELHTASSTGAIGNCWQQTGLAGNRLNWNVEDNGSTPTFNTGPQAAFSGLKYFYLEASRSGTEVSLISPIIDVSALNSPKLSFMYHMFGSSMGNLLIEVHDGNQWIRVDSIMGQQQTSGSDPWKEKSITLPHATNGLVKIRFIGQKNGGFGDIAIDDVQVLDRDPVDLAMIEISSLGAVCNLGSENIKIGFVNQGSDPLQVANVYYEINSTVVNEVFNGSVQPGDTAYHTFNTPYTYTQAEVLDLTGYVSALNDADLSNDTLVTSVIKTLFISSFPYEQDFESGEEGWIIENGVDGTFAFGTPNSSTIDEASSGSNAFVTNITGDYESNDESYVYSPCFDFTTLNEPHVQLRTFWKSYTGDGAQMQYSLDGGVTWLVLGDEDTGENWYNYSDYTFGKVWTGGIYSSAPLGSNGWITSTLPAPELAHQPNVRFRIAFQSNSYSQDEGFAFDDVAIFEGASLGNNTVLCASESLTLDPGSFEAYSWNDGTDVQLKYLDANLLAEGVYTYSVIVSGIHGYKMYDTVQVIVEKPVLELGNDSIICFGAPMVIEANPDFASYSWNDGSSQSNMVVDVNTAGVKNYSLMAISTNGCQVQDDISITVSTEVVVDLGVDSVFYDSLTQGSSYLLDAGPGFSSYLWNDLSTGQTLLVDPNNDGQISVVVSNVMGCTGTDTVEISFVLSIPDIQFSDLKMYPNPASEFIILEINELQNSGDVELRIVDITGKTQFVQQYVANGSQIQETIDVSKLNPGTYFLQIQINDRVTTESFVVH